MKEIILFVAWFLALWYGIIIPLISKRYKNFWLVAISLNIFSSLSIYLMIKIIFLEYVWL